MKISKIQNEQLRLLKPQVQYTMLHETKLKI